MRTERGQAMIEFVIGLFTFALVISALCGFALFMTNSLKAQNSIRTGSSAGEGKVAVGISFGTKSVEKMTVRETVRMPPTTIVR